MQTRLPALLLCLSVTGVISVSLTGCTGVCAQQRLHRAAYTTDSGPVHIHHMGGDIDVKDAPNGADLGTMGGNITVGTVSSYAKLSTMGGNIVVDRASGSVNASTMGGTITIRQVDGPVHASTMGGDVTVHVTGSSGAR